MRFSAFTPRSFSEVGPSLKRLVFSLFLVASCYLLVAISPTFAQVPQSTQSANTTNSYNTPSTNLDVPKNLHTYTQSVMIETMSALVCQLAGVDPVNPNQKCLGIDQKTGQLGFVENGGGAIGLMGNAIAMLYTPPIHSSDYFQNLASNFGIAKQAKAAVCNPKDLGKGFGFCAVYPLLTMWTYFRNIVYLLFVLIFVIVGIAIMLRLKIDPRTVMTIQNQIPKIIIGLLLVTFSFAIAGFLIDIMYTSIYLIGAALVQTAPQLAPGPTAGNLVNQVASSTNPFSAANYIGGATGNAGGLLNIVTGSSGSVKDIVENIMRGALGSVTGGVLGFLIGYLVGALALLVILIAIIFALFRLWFALISAYIFLLLNIVTAPFWIFAGLIPGSPIGFGLWLRDILSNLSAFVAAITMFILARVFMDIFAQSGQGAFSPPLVGNLNDTQAFGYLIGLGFILLTPNVVAMTKAALKATKFDTSPIKQALGAGAAVPGRGVSGATRILVGTEVNKGAVPEKMGGVLRAFGIGRH